MSSFRVACAITIAWVVGLKLWLALGKAGQSLGSALVTSLPDLTIALFVVAFATLVRAPGPRLGGLRRIASAIVLVGLTLTAGAAAAFVERVGSVLEYRLLANFFDKFSEQTRVVGAELSVQHVLVAVVPLLVGLFALRKGRVESVPSRVTVKKGGVLAASACATLIVQLLTVSSGPTWGTVALVRPLFPFGAWAQTTGRLDSGVTGLPEPEQLHEAWSRRNADAERPNVIVIVMESIGALATTVHDPKLDTTPFLAELARESVVFETAYCLVPHTTKSLVAIFAGHPPELRQEVREPGRLPAAGLPTLLSRLGYATAFFQPADPSFESRRLLLQDLGFDESYCEADLPSEGFERCSYLGLEDRALVDPVVDWVRKRAATKEPFFAGILNLTTHHDYKLPSTWTLRDFALERPAPDAATQRQYLNCLRYFDSVLREMFTQLREEKLLDDTVVILLGDHGEAFGEHGRIGHDDVPWEEGMHIPLLMYGPERLIGKPRRVVGLRHVLDVVPTVADLVGVPDARRRASPVRGTSLLAAPDPERVVYGFSWYDNSSMLRVKGRTKDIYYPRFDKLERFDLEADPYERSDLSSRLDTEARRDVVQDLLTQLGTINAWYAVEEERLTELQSWIDLPGDFVQKSQSVGPFVVRGLRCVRKARPKRWLNVGVAIEVAAGTIEVPSGSARLLLRHQGGVTNLESVLGARPWPTDARRWILEDWYRIDDAVTRGEATLVLEVAGKQVDLCTLTIE